MYTIFYRLSYVMAMLGGVMLLAIMLLTCISVSGRSMNGLLHSDLIQNLVPGVAKWLLDAGIGPVNGDFELIEAGVAFSIFAFIPLCQITGGHATVDIFTSRLSARSERILQLTIDVVFAAVLILIAVQLFSGMLSKMHSSQTTLLLEFPVWWAYAMSMTGAALASLVALYIAVIRLVEVISQQSILPTHQSADH